MTANKKNYVWYSISLNKQNFVMHLDPYLKGMFDLQTAIKKARDFKKINRAVRPVWVWEMSANGPVRAVRRVEWCIPCNNARALHVEQLKRLV